MLFNSPEFIYFFLPFSIAAWWVLQRMEREHDAQWLVVICSIYFYGWWDTRYVPLLIGNAIGNFYLGQKASQTKSKTLLITGLIYNIGLLGYFKYTNFFIENWRGLCLFGM
jgi:alginate O-acetyltransferase complex protein AlgI